jgi:hypothetical protein
VIALLSCASAEIQLRMVNVLLMLSAMSGTLLLPLPHAHALHDTVAYLSLSSQRRCGASWWRGTPSTG